VENLAAARASSTVVYDDIGQGGYPDAWTGGSRAIAWAGFYVLSTHVPVVGRGRPTLKADHGRDAPTTNAIIEHNRLIADDDRFVSSIVPTRDGVFVAPSGRVDSARLAGAGVRRGRV
jgi:hypothetical protein